MLHRSFFGVEAEESPANTLVLRSGKLSILRRTKI